jgi:hypothetical protein
MFVDVTALKGMTSFPPYVLVAVATLHVSGPQIVEMVHRSKVYPGPLTKTPTVPTVASVR